ncbi:hypothetical protein NQ314_003270 [Rhamnusium bicolor]|uniref:Uncharacterized protein n=1 Tax=Rhamnusium bicolor TaxID=1586634 RepID=A0AAV8ZMG5_9CUCU|nr:hypothetical protein NQ314_003270 [Rhamnusium bicolor]
MLQQYTLGSLKQFVLVKIIVLFLPKGTKLLVFSLVRRNNPVTTSDKVPSPPATTMASIPPTLSISVFACPSDSVFITSTEIPAKYRRGAQYFSNSSDDFLLFALGFKITVTLRGLIFKGIGSLPYFAAL